MENRPDQFSNVDAILESAAVGLAVLDEQLRYLRVNLRFAEMNGLSIAEHVGKRVQDVVPEVAETVEPMLREVLATGQPVVNVEITFEPDDGQGRRSRTEHFTPLRNKEGAVVGVLVTAVRDQYTPGPPRADFWAWADVMPHLVWTATTDGAIEYHNWHAFQFSQGAEQPGDTWPWEPILHPEDRERTVRAWRKAVESGMPFQVEHRILQQDGRYSWYLSRARLVTDAQGKGSRWYGTATNIDAQKETERALRESEQKYRAMFELSTVGQAELDLSSGRYLSVNARFCEITGYTVEELLQMTYEDVTHPQDVNQDHLRFGQLLRGEEEEYLSYKRYVRKDGEIRWVEARARLIRDAEGNPIRSLGSVVDITDRVEAEVERERLLAQLAQEQERLAHLNQTLERRVKERTAELVLAEQRERQRIAQVLHDDVQQMLYSIQLTLHVLRDELQMGSGDDLEQLERHIAAVIDATRSLSTELQLPAVQRERVEESFQWLSQFMNNQYGLQVDVDVQGECRIAEPASRELVVRSVRELLFNVVKHAGVQRAQLLAREEPEWLVVEVVDQGAGFEVEEILVGRDNRTGLGISTIQERLELLGGHFHVSSQPGAGTTITLRIPLDTMGLD
jgi:PAS domain S-box-containing protein